MSVLKNGMTALRTRFLAAINFIRKIQQRLTPQARFQFPAVVFACLLSGLIWALLIRLIDDHSIRYMLASLKTADLWLTTVFLWLLVLALVLLSHNLFVGNLVVGFASVLLAMVNYFKVLLTTVPLTIGDFSLITRMGTIAQLNSQAITFDRNSILAFWGAAGWLLITLLLSRPLRIRWRWSAPAALAPVLAFVMVFWMQVDPLIYARLGVDAGERQTQADANESCGLVLGLWKSLYYRINQVVPEGYSQEHMNGVVTQVEDYTSWVTSTEQKKQPNIILILSESFFDITELEGVTFDEDPVSEFHALRQEGVSGNFYTRSVGYGTCNIELEILTGINSTLLPGEELHSWSGDQLSRLPTVPGLLKDAGYYTGMIHPFHDGTYGRKNFFYDMGLTDLYFNESYADFYAPAREAPEYWTYLETRISGRRYSDDLLSDLLIALYDQRKEEVSDRPVFLYGISMENHSIHSWDKYTPEELTVDPKAELSYDAEGVLVSAAQGISNASAALGKLTDHFRTVDEPVIIVFYGDHRPGLTLEGGGSVYSELGIVPRYTTSWSMEDYEMMYSTEYLIWSNDPSYLPGEPGSVVEESTNYFGVKLLDLAGVEKPLYWKLLDRLSQYRSQDTTSLHRSVDGQLTAEMPQEGEAALGISLMTELLNDAIYQNQYVTDQIG